MTALSDLATMDRRNAMKALGAMAAAAVVPVIPAIGGSVSEARADCESLDPDAVQITFEPSSFISEWRCIGEIDSIQYFELTCHYDDT